MSKGRAGNDDIEFASGQAGGKVVTLAFFDNQPDAREAFAETAYDLRQEAHGRGGGEADSNVAALSGRRASSRNNRLIPSAKQVARSREEYDAGGSELDLAGAPDEQRQAEFGFRSSDLLAERRLGHPEAFGCAREVQLLGDRYKAVEIAKIQYSYPYMT
jgi:hypothetical protein